MAKRLKYYVIHATDTPAGRPTSSDEIRQWHLGPLDKAPGVIVYLGKNYPSREALPKDKIGGVEVSKLKGRGWTRVGYREMIHLDGTKETLNKYNYDAIVDAWEITNGVAGINGEALHTVYVGGKGKNTLNPAQKVTLKAEMLKALKNWPWILFAGHNQFDLKICPSFDVRVLCREFGIPEANIYQVEPKLKLPV